MPTIPHPYLADPLPRAFAHRGWHLDDMSDLENSLPAFQRADAEGYRYLETDVHATADGVVVVHHDARLDRTTDATGPIAHQSWQTVSRAKIGGKVAISRLEDILEELPGAFFNVDIKSSAAVEPFVRVIQRLDAFDRVAAAAFSDARLARLRKLAGPRLLTSLGPRSAAVLWANGWVPFLRLGFLSSGLMAQVPARRGRMTIVDKAFLRAARNAGVEVHTWTINDPQHMRALLDLGVDGIVTDRPDLLREVLIERGAWPSGGANGAA
ncbi:glycerophosphodiester phosphodiesterase [Prauserella cavernicola]|uniref:Glycerophosphodiester phosphodiesterase n=1 Tax=Prauserella cavernicola TaxID=2800127 RepID=A0A934QP04_9PSEU|nr:glycerophosphodiester phosphodiesterase [Prauserella cavernicola]MBK1783094.1 glycerophosphodiester phosphodiesterase [Prauserella cavernicola]